MFLYIALIVAQMLLLKTARHQMASKDISVKKKIAKPPRLLSIILIMLVSRVQSLGVAQKLFHLLARGFGADLADLFLRETGVYRHK